MSSGIDLLGPASAAGAVTARPTDTRVFGAVETWFAPCTSQSSRDGTQLQAEFLNGLLAQIRYAIKASGVEIDNADDAMLWEAIRSLTPAATLWHYGADASNTAALLQVSVKPGISSYERFVAYSIIANNAAVTAEGGTQANFGPGLRALTRADGSPIRKGDWAKGDIVLVIDDGDRLRLAGRSPEAPVAYFHSGVAGGTTGAITATVVPAIGEYEDRLPILLRFPAGVANNATAALNALPPLPLQRNDGSAIQSADIPPGASALFTLLGTTALRLIGLARGEVQRIAINPTLYVRPDGNDGNDGLSNTPGGAFATIAAALAKGTSQFNFASSSLMIQLGAPATYAWPLTLPRGTGTININGDLNNATAYVIEGAAQPGAGCIQTSGPLVLSGVTVRNTGTSTHGVATTGVGTAVLFNTVVASTQTTAGSHLFAVDGSGITLGSGCLLQGNAAAAFSANGGRISVNPGTNVVIGGSPTFSDATAVAQDGGRVSLLAGASVSGAASGRRYRSDNYSIINTNGGGANAFPGSTAGTTSNGLYQ